jgi:hypothetical protein
MTTTPIARSLVDRVRFAFPSELTMAPACAQSPATGGAAFHGMAPMFTTTVNLWLGGVMNGSGSHSKYATKRIAPGRLEAMT